MYPLDLYVYICILFMTLCVCRGVQHLLKTIEMCRCIIQAIIYTQSTIGMGNIYTHTLP